MRRSREETRQTRERIVRATSRLARERGFDGVSIGALMGELEMTHGGFYRHFETKDALFAEALGHAFREVQAGLHQRPGGEPTLRGIIATYLSPEHAADPGGGCPVAALAVDTARASDTTRAPFDAHLEHYLDSFLPLMPGADEVERRTKLLVLFSGMAGALSAARAVSGAGLRASILTAARDFYTSTFCDDDHA